MAFAARRRCNLPGANDLLQRGAGAGGGERGELCGKLQRGLAVRHADLPHGRRSERGVAMGEPSLQQSPDSNGCAAASCRLHLHEEVQQCRAGGLRRPRVAKPQERLQLIASRVAVARAVVEEVPDFQHGAQNARQRPRPAGRGARRALRNELLRRA